MNYHICTFVFAFYLIAPTYQQTTKTPKQRYNAEQMSQAMFSGLRKREAGCGENHFSPKDIDRIVEYHNTCRSQLAQGKLVAAGKQLGPAKNMEKMSWDCELYRSAQNEANDCLHERLPSYQGEGKATYFKSSHSKSTNGIGAVIEALLSWIHVLLRDGLTSVLFDSDSSNAIDATQMLWHDSNKVGCGIQTCDVDNIENTIVICHYSQKGNVNGQNVYDSGSPCTGCPSGSSCDTKSELCGYD